MSVRPRQILVGIRLVEALREVLQGIINYMKTNHRDWQLQCVDAGEFEQNLGERDFDGVITHVSPRYRERIGRVRRSGAPTVNMLLDMHPTLPSVVTDDVAVGRVGADYFIARGFKNFAFLGIDVQWSHRRYSGFVEALKSAGHADHLGELHFPLEDYRVLDTGRLKTRLQRWVESLPKPLALMACSDLAGRALLLACEKARLQVPDDVAILGVDNIVAICELASVPISSVAQDFSTLGFEAARLLDRLMARKAPPKAAILVPPGPIVVRRSTDIFAFEDEHVATAMRMIHERAGDGLGMKQLMNETTVSRKWLDIRFKALIGHTPSQEIRRVRLTRVRDLLMNTDLSIQQIAERCAFGCAENLIRFFRQAHGLPPHEYRVRHRGQVGALR